MKLEPSDGRTFQKPNNGGKEDQIQSVAENADTREPLAKYFSKEYFELELEFARHVAQISGKPLSDTLLTHTDFHSRFGQGTPNDKSHNPVWHEYIQNIARINDPQALVDMSYEFYRQPREHRALPKKRHFGCFWYDYHPGNDDTGKGVIEIHFANNDLDGTSPLSKEKRHIRLDDLADMFREIREKYPDMNLEVHGSSWLYDPRVSAYRSLFPESYIASAEMQKRTRFQGAGAWGQFIDHEGKLKQAARAEFLANLKGIHNPEELYLAFPLKTYHLHAPIDVFYRFRSYGIDVSVP